MKTEKDKKQIVVRELHTSGEVHLREVGEGEEGRTITGYAILFNTPSAPLWQDEDSVAREVIDPGAATKEFLDTQDIKFTMFHDRQLILARSCNGAGTLSYSVDDKGVSFSFDAPDTEDGKKALELVKRGDLKGCSFMYTTRYYDEACVERTANVVNGQTVETYRVKAITGIYDFTLAADPAYPDTSVTTERELVEHLREHEDPNQDVEEQEKRERENKIREQVSEMRRAAARRM